MGVDAVVCVGSKARCEFLPEEIHSSNWWWKKLKVEQAFSWIAYGNPNIKPHQKQHRMIWYYYEHPIDSGGLERDSMSDFDTCGRSQRRPQI